jgi:DNA-binding NtrC family response regulator
MKPITALLVMPSERRGVVLEQIEDCGVHVFVAGGLEEARGILRSRPVDLVFTDCTFPDGDWRDIVTHSATAGLYSEVILCAKRLEAKLCSEAFAKGVWDVIAESCTREDLQRTIESAASRTYMHSLGLARRAGAARAAS